MRSIVVLVSSVTRVGSCTSCIIWNKLKHEIRGPEVPLLLASDTSKLKSPVTIISLHSEEALSMISLSLPINSTELEGGL